MFAVGDGGVVGIGVTVGGKGGVVGVGGNVGPEVGVRDKARIESVGVADG